MILWSGLQAAVSQQGCLVSVPLELAASLMRLPSLQSQDGPTLRLGTSGLLHMASFFMRCLILQALSFHMAFPSSRMTWSS